MFLFPEVAEDMLENAECSRSVFRAFGHRLRAPRLLGWQLIFGAVLIHGQCIPRLCDSQHNGALMAPAVGYRDAEISTFLNTKSKMLQDNTRYWYMIALSDLLLIQLEIAS